jgi:amidophosphoribosyltransferase
VINAAELRIEMAEEFGSTFDKTSDTEVIAEMYAKAPGSDWFEVSAYVMRRLKGAYALVIMTKDQLIAVRDPLGIRPLCLGTLDGGWVVASETAALDNLGAEFVRELEQGETIVIDKDGVQSKIWSGTRSKHAMCIFEQIYFARPDSLLNGELAYETRQRLGAEVYREHPVDADIVVGIPDSSTPHAVGLAAAAKIPYTEAIIRNRYVGRTFIQPDQRSRDQGVKMLRKAGAKEVHVRVASPPIISTCHFGVDMATLGELIASNKTVEEIRDYIGADSLAFLSVEGLLRAVRAPENAYCTGCFTGNYPIPVQLEMNKLGLEVAPSV